MRRESRIAKKAHPYLYDQYNVSALTMATSQLSNALEKTINCFIEGMNKHRLPRIIVMMLDGDLAINIDSHNKPGVSNLIGKVVSWLTSSIEQLIEIKKEDLFQKRRGTLTSGEPKIIWIKATERPADSKDTRLLKQKFNDILEETLVSMRHQYITSVGENLKSPSLSDFSNNLTNDGKVKIWQELDQQIHQFDKQELLMKPRPVISQAQSETKRKLPKPPPLKI